jgi:tetratricopeptide (TPR) repeat protein
MAFYTIKENKELIIWNRNDTGGMIHLRYEKKPTELTTAETELTIDNDSYSKLLLTYAACGEILYSRGEEDRAAKLYNHALAIAKKAYNFYNNIMFEDIN